MGFLSGIFSATIKAVLTPVAIVKDVANVVTDNEPDATKQLIESSVEDVKEAIEDLSDGEL